MSLVMPDFNIDNLTVILLALLAALAIYHRFFSVPSPLVHPLLLSKQSEVSAVRKSGETGIYRSWATGQGTPVSQIILRLCDEANRCAADCETRQHCQNRPRCCPTSQSRPQNEEYPTRSTVYP